MAVLEGLVILTIILVGVWVGYAYWDGYTHSDDYGESHHHMPDVLPASHYPSPLQIHTSWH
ncbi:MAG: hypothetical protein F4Y18_04940 [Cenarchaeum sp. SB0663_bin_5]|nr:hypothetical protein [Cenarchaeum sp. SB0663_bin_5]MYH03731.1 hypothetical protein [Cenarchaeum sp. SB0675_bin_21]MYL10665.1 hypothetical protein [Cenarchaeum sp. SB0669_bin_11]